jgi:hypothetical protein
MIFMSRATACVAVSLVASACGQISSESQEVHVTFPLRDRLGKFLKPSLLQGVDMFTTAVSKQWEEEGVWEHNGIKTNTGFCFTITQDARQSRLTANEDEEIFYGVDGDLGNGKKLMAASKQGHVSGRLCCAGNIPTQAQLVMTKCSNTSQTMLTRDGPMDLEQIPGGEGLLQATIDADGSSMMGSFKDHDRPGLMRSEKQRTTSIAAEGAAEANDPRIFPAQILMATLHDDVGGDSLDLAVEQVAHLARATSGLVVVDKRLFGRLMKELGSHSARSRVVDGKDSGPMYVWR